MNEQSVTAYDPHRVKRIARESTPFAAIIAFVLALSAHEPWWFVLSVAFLAGIGNYWFWRGCGYLASRLMRGSR